MNHKILLVIILVVCAITLSVMIADAQGPNPRNPRVPRALAGTAFTYQGQLKKSGALATSTCNFQFGLWDASTLGNQVGSTQTVPSLAVTNGLFTTPIDFGSNAFTGEARWLATAVLCTGDGGYTALTPRQALNPAPMAFALPGLYTYQNATSPNVIGGYNGNVLPITVTGGTIGGGGTSGFPNRVLANYAAVGGGIQNTASGTRATVGGGDSNLASNLYATVGGGWFNTASGDRSTVGGGMDNTASADLTTISGGLNNLASNPSATIGGGRNNTASSNSATVGGGYFNNASGITSTIAGGQANTASNDYATVGGGFNNTANGSSATVAGGSANYAGNPAATVGGGSSNSANNQYATVGGGGLNSASGGSATVSGGVKNIASGFGAFVGGGGSDGTESPGNSAGGNASTISGGISNTITTTAHYATIGGGKSNTANNQYATIIGGVGNTASGYIATVAGGGSNVASGNWSFAAGTQAKAMHDGTFVWADSAGSEFASTAIHQFLIRADGGVGVNTNNPHTTMEVVGLKNNSNTLVVRGDQTTNRRTAILLRSTTGGTATSEYEIGTDLNIANSHNFYLYDNVNSAPRLVIDPSGNFTLYPSSGSCSLSTGGTGWSCSSDRNLKENFQVVAPQTILQRVNQLPISTWTVKGSSVPHLGPMAQDFYAAFGLGEDGLHINTVDAQGVALAAIQGLYQENQELIAQTKKQQADIDNMKTRVAALEQAMRANNMPTHLGDMPTTWVLFGGLMILGFTVTRRHK